MAILKNIQKHFSCEIKTPEMEIALANHFGYLQNTIVHNVKGLVPHECDLLIATPAGYAYEIEIKVSKADLIKDKKKLHCHLSEKIKRLYFAIPDYLQGEIEHIPERAGIITVRFNGERHHCQVIREPLLRPWAVKLSTEDRIKLSLLASKRIWSLKMKISKMKKQTGLF